MSNWQFAGILESQPLLRRQPQLQSESESEDEECGAGSAAAVKEEEGGGMRSESDSDEKQMPRSKSGLQRCRTAPAMDMAAVLRELQGKLTPIPHHDDDEHEDADSSGIQIRQAGLLLLLYLITGVVVYGFNRDQFSGAETHPVVDALYFCIVTMCTIGYGDITPLTPSTKLFACFFVLVGFGFIDILLSAVVNHVLDLQERNILSGLRTYPYPYPLPPSSSTTPKTTCFFIDVAKGRMRIRLKVALALSTLVFCIGVGALALSLVEGLSWVDSLYLSALSVTTVGYGDRAFNTLPGRLFAAFWLLFSTLAVARAFLFLVEARIDKRHRTHDKLVLQRAITPQDLLAANINNNDFITYAMEINF